MNNGLIDSRWAVTAILLFVISLVVFLVFALLGVFFEGSLALSQDTRGSVILAWGVAEVFVFIGVLTTRHG